MNDFTKEELKEIWESLDVERLQSGVYVYTELMNKIQSMIDNYCDHEWENMCCACDLYHIYCHKCTADMGHLKQRVD